ncbi:MAG: DUF501 domain-containing protein [Actinomycetota bacterium]|nr:DUF501 domain-containing protein [Actinomycetota bacterium]
MDAADRAAVEALLGRPVRADFTVVVRDASGAPLVIQNAPLLEDDTPMPTRYWLVSVAARAAVGRLEARGGVAAAQRALDPAAIAAAHERYRQERDAALPAGHTGPVPGGGVGGTRQGVKCLHAHLAWYLAGGRDPVGRWVASQLPELEGPVAAIDLGTNSVRLLVLSADGTSLERQMTITRLGEGLGERGEIGAAALARTAAVLARYRDLAEGHGALRLRAAATAAVRDAANGQEVLEALGAALGTRPELLSGEEEGRLAYRGATGVLAAPGGVPWLVVDLGGGSTELIAGAPAGEPGPIAAAVSLPLGCVRVAEAFLSSDPPSPSELEAARRHVRAVLAAALAAEPALASPRPLLGVAGTVAALCALHLDRPPEEFAALHGTVLGLDDVRHLVAALAAEPLASRRARRSLEAARADVIVGGGIVLEELMVALGAKAVVHSSHDLLDGLAESLLVRPGEVR